MPERRQQARTTQSRLFFCPFPYTSPYTDSRICPRVHNNVRVRVRLASYPGHFLRGRKKRPGTICLRMRKITQNLGNSDTRVLSVYFQCIYKQLSFPLHGRLYTCMGLYTMAGLSKCVDEFSEESLVGIWYP